MKFLFLDIECANKFSEENKICLINTVVVDDKFSIISKKESIINPKIDFDEYVLKYLPYDKNEFDNAKTFSQIYDDLFVELNQDDQVIIARNGSNDIKLLKQECNNNNLLPFTLKFYDFNEIYFAAKKVLTEKDFKSLSEAKFFRNGSENVDLMVKILNELCSIMSKSLREILIMAINSEGFLEDNFISFRRSKDVINPENTFNSNMNRNSNYKAFHRFLANVKKTEEIDLILENKNVLVSTNFETDNFKEMINLITWLKNAGANYVLDPKNCDIFVNYDTLGQNGKVKNCGRLNKVEQLKMDGKLIEILTLEELLNKLGKTIDELFIAPLPNLEYIYDKDSNKATPYKKYVKIRKNF
ncbi:MAG: hypothetical protein IJW82_08145 [Clostridia bacterium]|nr:hypothetical protein [Clostridia bacterium]